MTCTEGECRKPVHARGFCQTHYARHRRAGDLGGHICRKPSCSRVVNAIGLCEKHYQYERKLATGWTPRTKDETAWYVNAKGYVVRKRQVGAKRVVEFQHREIMAGIIRRPLLSSEEVHHKNGVRNDNRPENLELWSTSQPKGQRVEDKVAWAREIIALYSDLAA